MFRVQPLNSAEILSVSCTVFTFLLVMSSCEKLTLNALFQKGVYTQV